MGQVGPGDLWTWLAGRSQRGSPSSDPWGVLSPSPGEEAELTAGAGLIPAGWKVGCGCAGWESEPRGLPPSPPSRCRYDIVFLPPSFPIVAMENPCLTFIISSILESDEFLVIDVIHEVAHSWFGNAVTNATWEEMWLSEGLATYAQRRITTETYGAARAGEGSHGGPGHWSRGREPSLAPLPCCRCPHLLLPPTTPTPPHLSSVSGPHPGAAFTCLETAFRLDALHRQMKLLGEDSPVSKLQVKLEPGTCSSGPAPRTGDVTPQGLLACPSCVLAVASLSCTVPGPLPRPSWEPLARARPPQAPTATAASLALSSGHSGV